MRQVKEGERAEAELVESVNAQLRDALVVVHRAIGRQEIMDAGGKFIKIIYFDVPDGYHVEIEIPFIRNLGILSRHLVEDKSKEAIRRYIRIEEPRSQANLSVALSDDSSSFVFTELWRGIQTGKKHLNPPDLVSTRVRPNETRENK